MIKGVNVIIRSIIKSDRESYFNWINDRELVHFNSIFKPISELDHHDWFEKISKLKNLVIYSIIERSSNILIGSCSLRNINYVFKSAELQIRIGEKDYHNTGFGSEAIKLLLKHAFLDLNLKRVYLYVFENNLRAVKAYKKCGFLEEGCLRSAAYIDGKYLNIKLMAILKNEYIKL